MNTKYDDILNVDYGKIKSKRHPNMSKLARAAQFAPFAALTGHDEAIEETADSHKAVEVERVAFFDDIQ